MTVGIRVHVVASSENALRVFVVPLDQADRAKSIQVVGIGVGPDSLAVIQVATSDRALPVSTVDAAGNPV